MSPPLVILILCAAAMHATWNALMRSSEDRLASISMMSIFSAAVAALFCFLLPPLSAPAWPFVLGSAAIQVAYCVVLARAYTHGALSHVYPLARGAAPLLVALAALIAAGERPSLAELAGLGLISGGIAVIALGSGRLQLHATISALCVGALIAAYMVVDGMGVRLSANPPSYIAWLMVALGLPMPLVYRVMRGRWPRIRKDAETIKSFAGGLLGLAGYGIVVWAMSGEQMARVSGLRETSILFATIIGIVFLKEPLTWNRLVSAAAITAGVVFLAA
jgi:drug/metabolite transporter (DMT)-like permease